MAKYRVTSPDGQTFEITAPDNATPDQVRAYAQQAFAKPKPADNLNAETLNPTQGMSAGDRFLAGVGKAITDTGRGVGQLVGAVSREDVAQARARDKALSDTTAGKVGDIAGTVGMTLLPGGALKAAAMLPMAGAAAPALSAAGTALLAPRTITGAAALGAGMGAIQPSTSTSETIGNVALGGIAAGAVPAIVRGLDAGKAAAEPLYAAGQDRIVGRLMQKAAGGDAQNVANRLRSAVELVPGSVPTVGQAAGNPGIAALERTASAIDPAVGKTIADRLAAQNQARVDMLRGMAGSDGARTFYDESRRAAAEKLYKEAYDAGMDLARDATTGQFLNKAQQAARKGEITKLMSTPSMQDAVKEARRLMADDPNLKGKLLDPMGSVQGLDYTRRALSDMIEKAGVGSNQKRILINLRDRLDTTLDKISPKYAEARTTFREMSKPINQMDVAQEIADKSINKLTDKLQPQAFARALSDDTAARVTTRGATLDRVMEPGQLAQLNALKADLARAVAAENVGRGVGSDTVQKLAYSNMIDAAGIPSWVRNFAPAQIGGNALSRGADALYGRANREMAARLADAMTDPQDVARLLLLATQTPGVPFGNALARAGAAGGMMVPAVMNGRQ